MPKSKKLMKLKVDVGSGAADDRRRHRRSLRARSAGRQERSSSSRISSRAKMMGIESNGMVLAASPDGGVPIVVNAEPAAPGTRVR